MVSVSTICIPRMETCFKREYILNKLLKLQIGTVETIREIPLKNEPTYKRVLLQIQWNEEPRTENIKKRLFNNDSIKLVHDGKWYWKLLLANGS